MKNGLFRRWATALLALAMLMSLFTVCGSAEEASLEELPVGFQVDFDRDMSAGACWIFQDFAVEIPAPLAEGQQLRSVLRMNAPAGINALHRVYSADGQTKVFDDVSTSVSTDLVDETYGYTYKEYAVETTVSAAASGLSQLHLYLVDVAASVNYKDHPWQIFGWDMYDVATDELVFTYDAKKFTEQPGCMKVETSPVLYQPPVEEELPEGFEKLPVGFQVDFDRDMSAGACWIFQDFDVEIPAPLAEGQQLRSVLRMNAPAGVNALHRLYDTTGQTKVFDDVSTSVSADLVDETYGYTYKEYAVETTVSAAANGLSQLHLYLVDLSASVNYKDNPWQIFGWDMYDATTNELIFTYDAKKFTEQPGCMKVETSPILYQPPVEEEPVTSWDYKDMLVADDGINMEGTYPSEEEVKEELPVGFQVDFNRDISAGACWIFQDFVVDIPAPLTEGQRLRSVLRMNAPAGISAVHRVYDTTGQIKVFDDGSSSVNAGLVDETYGYVYNEYCAETVVSAAANGLPQLKLYLVDVGGINYQGNPWQIFGWDMYDATTNELICSYDASQFKAQAGCMKVETSPILYNPLYRDTDIGFTAIMSSSSQGPFVSYDVYSNIGQSEKPVEEGDVLQLGVKIWKPDGWMDLQPFYASLDHYPNALTDPDNNDKTSLFNVEITTEAQYEEFETLIDETYGYEYKLILAEHMVTAEEAAKLNAKRCNPIIGSRGSQNYIDSPLSVYGYHLYNLTQDYCYAEMNGAQMLASGGTGTINEVISIRKYDVSYATAGAVKAKREVAFPTLTAEGGEVGQYGYTFDVRGEAGKKYILKAYAVDEEGNLAQVGQKTFAATGEQESVSLLFNLREANANATLCFGIDAAEAALSVNIVTYDGRIGDCSDSDEFELQTLANPVIEMIEELPVEIALSDEEAILAARAAYDALASDVQALVSNLAVLEESEAALAALKENKEVADAVTAQLDALTEESTEEAVVAARAAYEALTEAQKALVSAEAMEKLVALEEKFQLTEIAYGDVDGNGKVDAADALKALQHAVKLTTLEGDVATAADVNGDDKIDATDALLMLQYTVKLINSFPVQQAKA